MKTNPSDMTHLQSQNMEKRESSRLAYTASQSLISNKNYKTPS